jgi:proline racemase
MIQVIDTHTMGEATRITVAGLPFLKGSTVMEQKQYMHDNHDWLRKVQILEPRGHADMFGCLLVKPNHPEADFGMIFTDCGGYLNMCGHGTIGVSTMLVEMGYVKKVEPYTHITLEAPAGLIRVKVKVTDDRVESVSFINVPAFLYKQDCKISMPGIGDITFDIAFGGSFFALLKASELKLDPVPANVSRLVPIAMEMRDIINREFAIQHPTLPIHEVDLIEIYGPPANSAHNARNIVIFGDGNVDRSPCGTGTSAKLATLHAKGQIGIGVPFIYESVLGTIFTGEILEETTVGSFKAVVPQITGSAYITGFNQFVIDENDPLKHGFQLGR